MAILFTDGCDSNYTGFRKWSSYIGTVAWEPDTGVYGGGAIHVSPGATDFANYVEAKFRNTLYTSNSQQVVTFWFKFSNLPTATSTFLNFYDKQNNATNAIVLKTNGRYYANYTYVPSAGMPLEPGVWQHLAINMAPNYFGLYLNGEFQYSYGNNQSGARTEFIRFGNLRGADYWIDDIVVYDDTDVPYNTVFKGYKLTWPTRITTLRPTADTGEADSTPSEGTDRYILLRKTESNTSNYISFVGENQLDLYTYPNVTSTKTNAYVITVTTHVDTGSVGYANVINQINLNSSIINATSNLIYNRDTAWSNTANLQQATFLFDINPLNNTSFTTTQVNDMEIGVKRV